jgi:glycosyltransferase involved in cell wall biosynthesis
MKKSTQNSAKPKLAYVNFYSMPFVVDPDFKLTKFKFAFDFLFLLQDTFSVSVFDFIGVNSTFKKEEIQFNYIKRLHNRKIYIPWKLFFKLKKLKPDVVYIQGLNYPHLILLMHFFVPTSCKIFVHDHANVFPKGIKKVFFKWSDKKVASYFFTSTEMAKNYLNENLISSKNKITECVEGATNFSFNPAIKKDINKFLWVGRLDANKDPLTVLKGFNLFAKNNPEAQLIMFYENEDLLAQIIVFIKENNLNHQVYLKGNLPHHELEKWYQESTYFLLGSHKEGGPIALVEAMACGCIPIVTNIPAFRAMINDGKYGYLFTPGNATELHQILTSLEEKTIEKLREQVVHFYKKELSHQAIANKLTQEFLNN